MSKENLNRFCELVLADLTLQARLKPVVERDEFISSVIKLGAENGFDLTEEEIGEKMRENRRFWHERWI